MRRKIYQPPKVDFYTSQSSAYNFDPDFIRKDRFWKQAKSDFDQYFLNGTVDSEEYRIPKKIHQIWLGSKFPKEYKSWQKTWIDNHPDWEYILWTEKEIENFNFKNKEVFDKTPNYGSKSDILRYEILNRFGGLYIDTDFECFKPFDYLHLNMDFYVGIIFEKEFNVTNGIIGSVPGHPVLEHLINSINSPVVSNNTEKIHEITGPWALNEAYKLKMFDKTFRNVAFPVSYFFPFPNNKLHIRSERKIKKYKKPESLALHYWEVSWTRKNNLLGKTRFKILRSIPQGIKNRVKEIFGK